MALSCILHCLLFGTYAFGYYYDITYTHAPAGSKDAFVRNSPAGRFKYLTYINYVILQCGYFGLCVINDLIGTNLRKDVGRSIIQKFRDWLFTTIAFPIASLVCFLFWTLYMIDRNLIYPEANDLWFPKWLNHLLHTLPIAAILAESIIVYHTRQKGINKYLPLAICTSAYLAGLYYIANTMDFWVYPVFEVLQFPIREAVMVGMTIPAFLFLILGEKIHNFVWRDPKKDSTSKQRPSNKNTKVRTKKQTNSKKQK